MINSRPVLRLLALQGLHLWAGSSKEPIHSSGGALSTASGVLAAFIEQLSAVLHNERKEAFPSSLGLVIYSSGFPGAYDTNSEQAVAQLALEDERVISESVGLAQSVLLGDERAGGNVERQK
jgi:hypothetical protein